VGAGVLVPWLPSPAPLRQLLASGLSAVGLDSRAAALQVAAEDLGLGPEQGGCGQGKARRRGLGRCTGPGRTGREGLRWAKQLGPAAGVACLSSSRTRLFGRRVHDVWTRHVPPEPAAAGPYALLYRGNPYLLSPPVMSLVREWQRALGGSAHARAPSAATRTPPLGGPRKGCGGGGTAPAPACSTQAL
jgi:hypothetical protein